MEVDITQTAFANARLWYSSKKKQEEKKEKTVAAHDMAFKAAEKKTLQQLAQVGLSFRQLLHSLLLQERDPCVV